MARPISAFLHSDYFVGDWRVSPTSGTIRCGEDEHHLTRRQVEVLATLAADEGAVVRRSRLIDSIWDNNPHVGERAVTNAVYHLRKALGDDPKAPLIQTVARKGYLIPKGTVRQAPKQRRQRELIGWSTAWTKAAIVGFACILSLAALRQASRVAPAGSALQAPGPLSLAVMDATANLAEVASPFGSMRDDQSLEKALLTSVDDLPPMMKANMLLALGRLYVGQGNAEAATAALVEASEIRQELYGRGSIESAEVMVELAEVRVRLGSDIPKNAIVEANQILKDHRHDAPRLFARSLALVLHDVAYQQQDALTWLDTISAEFEQLFTDGLIGRSDPVRSQFLHYRGLTLLFAGQPQEAAQELEDALAAAVGSLGSRHPDTAEIMLRLGGTLHAVGEFERSRSLTMQALRVHRDRLGLRHPATQLALFRVLALHKWHDAPITGDDVEGALAMAAIVVRENPLIEDGLPSAAFAIGMALASLRVRQGEVAQACALTAELSDAITGTRMATHQLYSPERLAEIADCSGV